MTLSAPSLPSVFLDRLRSIHPHQYKNIIQSYNADRIGSFRINTLHISTNFEDLKHEIIAEFKHKNIEINNFFDQKNIFIFDRKFEYAIKGTQSFYTGKIYLQSIASLLPALVLDPQQNTKILDVCSAPGSKTTQIAALTNNTSEIIALEKNALRYKKLKYNIDLQNVRNIRAHKIDARRYLLENFSTYESHKNNEKEKILFDAILLDAPCSAEGRISAKKEKSYGFWTIKNIQQKANLQYELLSLALKNLRPGGTLVYSTCTLAPEENEGVVTKILEENPDIFLADIDFSFPKSIQKKCFFPGVESFEGKKFSDTINKTLRVLPSIYTEGFFLAKLQKKVF